MLNPDMVFTSVGQGKRSSSRSDSRVLLLIDEPELAGRQLLLVREVGRSESLFLSLVYA